jgi:hypothetical protein
MVRAGLQTVRIAVTARCLPAPAMLAVSGGFDDTQVKSAPWRSKCGSRQVDEWHGNWPHDAYAH